MSTYVCRVVTFVFTASVTSPPLVSFSSSTYGGGGPNAVSGAAAGDAGAGRGGGRGHGEGGEGAAGAMVRRRRPRAAASGDDPADPRARGPARPPGGAAARRGAKFGGAGNFRTWKEVGSRQNSSIFFSPLMAIFCGPPVSTVGHVLARPVPLICS